MRLADGTSRLTPEVKTLPDLKRTIRTHFTVALLGFAIAMALYVVAAVLLLGPNGLEASFIAGVMPPQVSSNLILLVSTAVALTSVLGWLVGRMRIVRNPSYRRATGCPSCHRQDLLRIRRTTSDRFAGKLIALPVERHACRSCDWQGLLVGSSGQFISSQGAKQMQRKRVHSATGSVAQGASQRDSAAKPPRPARATAAAATVPAAKATQQPATYAAPSLAQRSADATVPVPRIHAAASQIQSQPALQSSAQQPGVVEAALPPQPVAKTSAPETAPTVKESPAQPASSPVAAIAGAASEVEPISKQAPSSAPPLPVRPLPELRVRGQGGRTVTIPPLYVAPAETAVSVATEPIATPSKGTQVSGRQVSNNVTKTQPVIETPSPAIRPDGYSGPAAIVIATQGLKLRTAPRADAEALRTLPLHAVVLLKGEVEGNQTVAWREVTFDDTTGWVSSAFLRRLPDRDS